ncbi:MAG: fused MFS/spermidine synthase [Herminiimonas sp.]|uniref:fused MFS/spermidine synthase n=1 Tax=Herminiimonas sp. TaxID=1926289 RepID=UPI00271FBDDC|nr:fused MFS/spermidine synthase [Herminiimonas sp.]MDO9420890.1 fused MFS/spermidine synthase [Herminiimonas sp.]
MDFFTPERIEKTRALAQDGKPFVFDDGDMRTLHFNEQVVQSAMRLSAPDELVIPYTQAMAGFVSLHPAPKHILMIGLGGGSFAKYCYRHFPSARITVLESNADVLALRDQFMIPADDARLQVLHVDAIAHLENLAFASVDVIMLDGFDVDGAPAALRSPEFFLNCKMVLDDKGVLIVNMGDQYANIVGTVTQGQAMFGAFHHWWFKVTTDNSHVAVAVNAVDDEVGDAMLRAAAIEIADQFSLELVYPKNSSAE